MANFPRLAREHAGRRLMSRSQWCAHATGSDNLMPAALSCARARLRTLAHVCMPLCCNARMPMFVVALVCQKGGAGKTTMAVHLAVEGHRRGLRTLLIDIDTQASAAKIMDRRGDALPEVATEAAGRLDRAIKIAEAEQYELVVVDTAPQADRAAAQ